MLFLQTAHNPFIKKQYEHKIKKTNWSNAQLCVNSPKIVDNLAAGGEQPASAGNFCYGYRMLQTAMPVVAKPFQNARDCFKGDVAMIRRALVLRGLSVSVTCAI